MWSVSIANQVDHITRFPRWNDMRVGARHTVEISGFEVVVDLEVGFTVTVFCTVSVTLDTAIVVVGFA
jgi:hypothetical protein